MLSVIEYIFAKENNLIRYFTNIPCQNGHISERRTSDKVCIQCEKEKAKRYFETQKGKISNYNRNHSIAAKERKKRYYLSEKGRVTNNKNNKTEKGKASRKRFDLTEKGKLCNRRNQHARRVRKINQDCIQYSFQDIKEKFLKFDNKCAYCGSDKNLTEDHFIPIAKGGSHRIENIIPACKKCNIRKNAQSPESWYKKQSFYSIDRWEKILCQVFPF